jgi:hypothetical protein
VIRARDVVHGRHGIGGTSTGAASRRLLGGSGCSSGHDPEAYRPQNGGASAAATPRRRQGEAPDWLTIVVYRLSPYVRAASHRAPCRSLLF